MVGTEAEELAEALAEFRSSAPYHSFGVSFLRDYVKREQTIPEDELSRYGLTLDIQSTKFGSASHYGTRFTQKYFDALFNFCLTYDGELIASLGFNPDEGRMTIQQIQGIKGHGDKLKPIKWERALVEYAVQWAEKYGIPEVAVISVDNNKWAGYSFNALKEKEIYPAETTFEDACSLDFTTERAYKEAAEKAKVWDLHLMPHQGFMLYDITAKRCGFRKGRNGNYIRRLGTNVMQALVSLGSMFKIAVAAGE